MILQSASFNASTPGSAIIGVAPFDPALGTLDTVLVTIQGTFSGTVDAPAAQPYLIEVDQNFFGLANKYFAFDGPGKLTFTGFGTGHDAPFGGSFSYEFQFNAVTDILGFSLAVTSGPVTPPIDIIGTRSRFLNATIPTDEVDLTQDLLSLVSASGTASGAMTIEYDFTPAPVPEPSSLTLVGVGVAGLALRACRRR
jgi:hypothetical protein